MTGFTVVSINVSVKKGEKKAPVKEAALVPEHGIRGDAHAGDWHRQVSLLAEEDADIIRSKGFPIQPGDFAENITTRGIELFTLPVGTKIRIGNAVLEVTQIGKECHQGCAIREQVGDCVMPRRGIFARVLTGGDIHCGMTGSVA